MMHSSSWPQTVDIIYREFYDVPRIFVFQLDGRWFLMDCPFDEAVDEYPEFYTLYELPQNFVVPSGSWEGLSRTAARTLGTLLVDSIVFDASLRRSVQTHTFQGLI